MNATDYAQAIDGVGVFETKTLGFQCVALVKDCVKKVFSIQLGSFGGSAKSGWANQKNTFPSHTWDRIMNDPTDKNQIPVPGDVIFINTNPKYEHTAVVTQADTQGITVIEQNTGDGDGIGDGDGKGDDDKAKTNRYNYSRVRGWYHHQMNVRKYEGIPVRHSDAFTKKKGTGAKYIIQFARIIITSDFFKVSRKRQEAVLKHEYAHHVYFKMPAMYRTLWAMIWNFDDKILKYLMKFGYVFSTNSYVTEYAKTSAIEGFAENVEEDYMGTIPEGKYAQFKMDIVMKIFNKFKGKV